jgi:hypothetical protein
VIAVALVLSCLPLSPARLERGIHRDVAATPAA